MTQTPETNRPIGLIRPITLRRNHVDNHSSSRQLSGTGILSEWCDNLRRHRGFLQFVGQVGQVGQVGHRWDAAALKQPVLMEKVANVAEILKNNW